MCPSFVHANLNPCLIMTFPKGIFSSSFATLLICASVGIETDFAFFDFEVFLDFADFLDIVSS